MKDRPERTRDERGGFLGRWAQRKSRVRRGEQPLEEAVVAPVGPETPAPLAPTPAPPPPDVEATHAEPDGAPSVPAEKPPLPSLESLTPDSDFSAFMSPDVDEALRRAALRKLFHSPAMNITDGLDDYADDFTKFTPLGNMITADMRHQVEVEAERARLKAEAAQAEADERAGIEQADTPSTEQATGQVTAEQESDGSTQVAELDEPGAARLDAEGSAAGTPDEDTPGVSAVGNEHPGPDAAASDPDSTHRHEDNDDEDVAAGPAVEQRRGDQTRG